MLHKNRLILYTERYFKNPYLHFLGELLFFLLSLIMLRRKPTKPSRPEVFCKNDVLRNFTKFTGKHLCQGLFLNKVADLSENERSHEYLVHKILQFLD